MKHGLMAFVVIITIISAAIFNSITEKTGIIGPDSNPQGEVSTGIIKIGVLLPLTGDDSVEGNKELLAIEFAHSRNPYIYVDDVLYEIELVVADTESDLGQLKVSARQMIHSGVFAIIGTSGFVESNELMAFLEEEEDAILIGTSGSKNEETPSNRNHFTVTHQDSFQGTMLANYSIEYSYDKVAVISQPNSENNNLGDAATFFISALEAYGGNVVFEQEYDAEHLGYIISELKSNNPQAVFLALDSTNGRELLQQMRAENITVPVFATDRIIGDTFEYNYAEGITVFQPFDERHSDNDDIFFFAEDFREYIIENDEEYGTLEKNNNTLEIGANSALAYDSYNALIYASDIIDEEDDLTLNTEDFIEALHMVDYMGVTGRIYFYGDGTVVRNAGYVNIIQNGSLSFVKKQYVGNSYQE